MTRYGFIDSDDEKEEVVVKSKTKKISNNTLDKLSPSVSSALNHQIIENEEIQSPSYPPLKKSPYKSVVFLPDGVDPTLFKSSQNYFRRQSDEEINNQSNIDVDQLNKFKSPIISPTAVKQFSAEKIKMYEQIRPNLDMINFYMSSSKPFYGIHESYCLKILKSVKSSMGSSTENLVKNISSFTSMTCPKRPVDYALSLGRSFRVGWSSTGKLAHAGKLSLINPDPNFGSFHRVAVEDLYKNVRINYANLADPIDMNQMKSSLLKLMQHSTKSHNSSEFPFWTLPSLETYPQFVILLKDLISTLIRDNSDNSPSSISNSALLKCIELIDAAYGQHLLAGSYGYTNLPLGESGYDKLSVDWYKRRQYLSNWLESLVRSPLGPNHLSNLHNAKAIDPFKVMFEMLSLHYIHEVTEFAMDSGNFRISTILSQIGGDEEVKLLTLKQLDIWKKLGALPEHIPESVVDIYRIISGDLFESEYGAPLLTNMSWMQALGMIFWYLSESDEKLSISLEIFRKAIEYENLVPYPYLDYDDGNNRSVSSVYHLLVALLCNPSEDGSDYIRTLHPSGYSLDPLDYYGSFIVLNMLESLGKMNKDSELSSHIRQQFISQLLSYQAWEFAIFVAMQIKDPHLRKGTLLPILMEWVGRIKVKDNQSFEICKHLDIPEVFIEESIRIFENYSNPIYFEEVGYFDI